MSEATTLLPIQPFNQEKTEHKAVFRLDKDSHKKEMHVQKTKMRD